MAQSRLAVLIPNYNDAHFLPRVLNSVLSQSKIPDEIWVSDDASTDNSLEVLDEFSRRHPQIQVLRNTENLGIPVNSFKPFYATSCDYVYTLGTDEYLVNPDTFREAVDILDRHPRAGLVCWDYAPVLPDGRVVSEQLQAHPGYLSPEQICRRLRSGRFPVLTNNSVMRLKVCLEPGTLCSEAGLNSDWVCCMNIAFRHGIYYLPGIYNHFPVRPDGLAVKSRPRIRDSLRQILEVLKQPQFSDVRHQYAESKAFANYLPEVVEVLLSRPEYWKYLSLRMAAYYLRIRAREFLPGLGLVARTWRKWSRNR